MPSLTRRQVLTTAGSASVALAGCLLDSPSGDLGRVEGAWPMVGQNPGHTRRVADGPNDPRTAWTTELDHVRSAGVPSVQDGRLYVPVDALSDLARHRYRVHALSASTGEERWRVPLRSEPNAPPAVSGDQIVVTARPALERGRVVCFQRQYGDEEWLVDVDSRLTAAPTIDGRVVYVPDWSGRVHALSASDGDVLWSREVGGEETGRTFAEPVAIHDGTLYLGSMSGTTGVVALDGETGAERWSADTDAVTGGPVVGGDLVVVRSHHLVVAFDTDGTRRWSFNVLEADARPMAVDDRHVYVPAREKLHAITRDGEPAWSYDSPDGRIGTPTVVDDSVLLRGTDRLTSLSRTDGEERWTVRPDGVGEVVVTPDAAFLTDGGRVMALGSA